MINVCHIIVGLDIGGAELMLKRLVESQKANPNYRHSVISLKGVGKVGKQLRELGVDVRDLGMRSFFDMPSVLWQLVRIIRIEQPDIVQTWMYHADLLGGLAAHLAGNRHVIWGIRTTDIRSCSLATSFVRRICARLSARVPSVIVCAAESSRQAHVAVGYDATKMFVVPNGYDFSWLHVSSDERKVQRELYGINQNFVVGSLGRFHADKDQQNFVAAAGLLASKHSQLRFLMVGRGQDWGNKQLVDWIISTGFKDRFVLLGERSDVPQCLAAMDVFCLHSRTEGFPNVLAEAMAMGLPCITTDVGDAAMLLGNAGEVVPKQDSVALARGIEKMLLLDLEARLALGVRAMERVKAEFTMDRASERFESIYRRVLNKGAI